MALAPEMESGCGDSSPVCAPTKRSMTRLKSVADRVAKEHIARSSKQREEYECEPERIDEQPHRNRSREFERNATHKTETENRKLGET